MDALDRKVVDVFSGKEVNSDLVVHHDKLLVGGIWCIVRIEYVGLKKEDDAKSVEEDFFGNRKKQRKSKRKNLNMILLLKSPH